MLLQYFERLIQTKMSFLKNDKKKITCKKKMRYKQNIRCCKQKLKKLQTKYITLCKTSHWKLKRFCKRNVAAKLKKRHCVTNLKTSLRSNVHMWSCKQKVVLQTKTDLQTEKKME